MAKVLPLIHSVALFTLALPAFAQTQAAATATYPNAPEAAAPELNNAGAPPTSLENAPPAPAPAIPLPPAPVAGVANPPSATQPVAPQPAAPPTSSPPANYATETSSIEEPAPPPPAQTDQGRQIPEFSIRVDPLNWLLEGRLGLELEVAAWKFITVETIPIFVVDGKPPLLNLGGIPDTLSQESNGLGALSGASIGAGFWLNGKPFEGTVLRFYYTNYGYKYVAKDDLGTIDSVKHTERFLVGMLGSHSKWGPFTIATGLGIGVEMNRERRCVDANTDTPVTSGCSDDEIVMRVQRGPNASTSSVTGPWHPVYLLGRISLGFVF